MADGPTLEEQIVALYPELGNPTCELVHSFVHDVWRIDAEGNTYALKLYRPGVRSESDVQWEADLTLHLTSVDAPVVPIVESNKGALAEFEIDGTSRFATLTEWAPGEKPAPSKALYRKLGRAAAQVHAGADTFATELNREEDDYASLVEVPVALMRKALLECNRLKAVDALAARIQKRLDEVELERGITHNDLTLDNVHYDGENVTIFDFDSARPAWRAFEPQGVYSFSATSGEGYWDAWSEGYQEVRPLPMREQKAVPLFCLIYELGNTAWKMGLTPTSVGRLMWVDDLAKAVNEWLAWETAHLS